MFHRSRKLSLFFAAVFSALLLSHTTALADFFESFEGGDSTGWAAVGGTESVVASNALPAAATDGTYALQVTSSAVNWDQQLKREGLIAEIPQYDTVELDIYVPALDNESGDWAQASLGFVSDTGGFQSMYQFDTGWADLSQGMNHVTWNYGADNIPVGGAWANFELVTNVSTPNNPISPYYIDSFTLSNSVEPEPYKSSWENSTDGWMLLNGFGLTPTNAAGGAPAGAITDGEYALKVDVGNETSWTQNIELNSTQDDIEAFHAMKANDTVEFDIFIEAGEILPETYTQIGMVLNHPGAGGNSGFLQNLTEITFDETGSSFHYSWKYGDDPNYNPDASWANFSILTNADNPSAGADPISEFYIDNFRFSTAVAGIEGDANGDGNVDLLDLDILGANFGTTGGATVATGDFNGDGNVDLLDLDILGGNFGASSNPASVPEPMGLTLVAFAAVAAVVRRRS